MSSRYRVSTKGLVVRDGKLMLCREVSGVWELPGGGLEHEADLKENLRREFQEEMGIGVTSVSDTPIYIWQVKRGEDDYRLFLGYKVEVDSLDFKKSDECTEIGFFSPEELCNLNLHPNVKVLPEIFVPKDF